MMTAKVEVGDDRKKALNVAIGQIEKQYGKGLVTVSERRSTTLSGALGGIVLFRR